MRSSSIRWCKKVSFTGGTATGKHIARIAADKLMPVTLELGGKSPTIVFDDADLDHAVNGVLFGIFSSSGESCIAGSRLFVQASIRERFLDRLVEKANALRVGDPEDVAHADGAAHHARAPRVDRALREARHRRRRHASSPAASVRRAASSTRAGSTAPTVIDGLDNRARLCQEEIFGPVLAVLPFERRGPTSSREANDSGIRARRRDLDARLQARMARRRARLDAGTVWINTYKLFSISTPFAGAKQSGIGIEKGRLGILQYKQQKSLYWGLNERPLPWAD